MIRILDIVLSFLGLLIFSPIILLITLIVLFETRYPFFLQKRVGRYKKAFILIKFRTMNINTKSVATHLIDSSSVTVVGKFLRKSKLDELPQLWNVLKGEMSLVGPRPNLFNQVDLILEREKLGIYTVRPGITGYSQLNDIDMSEPAILAKSDQEMIKDLTIKSYFSLIFQTILGKGFGDRTSTDYSA